MALETPFLFATKIETPLMLAALVVLVLYMLFRSHLSKMQSVLVFVLALVAIVLSISAKFYSDSVHPTRYWVEGYVYSPPLDERTDCRGLQSRCKSCRMAAASRSVQPTKAVTIVSKFIRRILADRSTFGQRSRGSRPPNLRKRLLVTRRER